jgi:hypothetical protein
VVIDSSRDAGTWRRLCEGTTRRDEMRWAMESSGKYTTKSLYRELTSSGIKDVFMMRIWNN